MKKNVIIIDADGVLLDIYKYLTYIFTQETGIEFDFSKEIKSWSMSELNYNINNINLRKYAMAKFNDPEFIYNINFIDDNFNMLQELYDFYKDKNTKLIIYTSAMNEKCKETRIKWFEDKIKPFMPDIEMICFTGNKPPFQCPDCKITAVIDDYIENLKLYPDDIERFLMTQCHNENIKNIENSIGRIKSFKEFCKIMKGRNT